MHLFLVKIGVAVLCLAAGASGGCTGGTAERSAEIAWRGSEASLVLPTPPVRSIVPGWDAGHGLASVDSASRNDGRLGTDGPGGIPAVTRSYTRFDDRQRMYGGRFFDSTSVRTRTYRIAPGQ